MIRFTAEGIYADTEEERDSFYTRMDAGDPIIMAHLDIYRKELKDLEEVTDE
jgi:hypothetical protein